MESQVKGPTPDWDRIIPVGGGGTSAVPPKCPHCDEWKRRAEEAEALIPTAQRYKQAIEERDALAVQNDAVREVVEEALREITEPGDYSHVVRVKADLRSALDLDAPRAAKIAELRRKTLESLEGHTDVTGAFMLAELRKCESQNS